MKRKVHSLYVGGVFLLAAVMIITERMGYLGDISLVTVILSVGLGGIILYSIPRLNFAGILFPAACLCILFDNEWGITALTPWTVLLTALLGSIGLSVIFHKKKNSWWSTSHYHSHWSETVSDSDVQPEVINSSDGNTVVFSTRFSTGIKYIESDNFKRANLQCDFGGIKVYFDNAIIQGDSADIYLEASFSGIELYLPRNWNVENGMETFLGGIDEHKGRSHNDFEKTVRLHGNARFSGIEIFYV